MMVNDSKPNPDMQAPTPAPCMPFGKHKGTPLTELSNDYLLWLGCLDDLRQPLLGHVLQEMGRRLAASEVKQ